jgi:isochorismate synthase EntC
LHLSTPITGTLDRAHHVLELVSKLHPTPAVGGVPTQAALDWIASHEAHSRGWYAAPVGWFGPDGDGLFDVALRSGVVDQSQAYLYAGAGIVRDSQADNEYAETRLKLASLFHALRAH